MSKKEFNAWQEIKYLLSKSTNIEHLINSIVLVRKRNVTQRELIDL